MKSGKERFLTEHTLISREGILGINRRNLDIIARYNPRENYPIVDDKRETKKYCRQRGIPVPETYFTVSRYGDIPGVIRSLRNVPGFAVKPSCGSEGNGILLVSSSDGDTFISGKNESIDTSRMKYHFASILSGLYSLGGIPDSAIVEQMISLHNCFEDLVSCGIPDIRIIVFKNTPVMAMLRLPTFESGGRANLYQGGIGAGVDMNTGKLTGAIQNDRPVDIHPDTGLSFNEFTIPFWKEQLEMAVEFSRGTGLGYLGVDIVIDKNSGPLLLEANARPGLSIQIANRKGLLPILMNT